MGEDLVLVIKVIIHKKSSIPGMSFDSAFAEIFKFYENYMVKTGNLFDPEIIFENNFTIENENTYVFTSKIMNFETYKENGFEILSFFYVLYSKIFNEAQSGKHWRKYLLYFDDDFKEIERLRGQKFYIEESRFIRRQTEFIFKRVNHLEMRGEIVRM